MTKGNGEVRELPKGWCFTTAIEACIKVIDCHNKTAPYINAGIKLVRTTNIRNGSINLANTKFVDQPTYEFWSRRCPPEPGDILFTREAPMAEVGMIPPGEKLCMGQRMMLLRADNKNLLAKYLLYALQSPYIHRYAEKVAVGTGVKHMRVRDVELLPILVAPLNEQHRIIEKIEELFSDLDQGIESLKTAQKQLKIYRQVVLKWAFEGKLTEEWRKQHSSTLKTGEELLVQIKTERENRYQQQLAEWETAVKEWEAIGKVGKKPTKPQKLKELPSLTEAELAELPKLPNGWCWVRYGAICLEVRNGISQKPDSDHGEKIFRISAVRPFSIDLQDFRYIDNSDHSYEDFLLKNNEILFTRYNSSRRYVGVCAKFNSNERFLYADKLIRTRLFSCELTLPDYIVCAANVGGSREYLDKRIRTTAGQSGVSGEDIELTPVPICSIKEQEQIVQEIESRLSICDQLEDSIIENLQKAEALRQSILKQAFEGKLVPQDPSDEPAEKLLERIKADREATQPPKTSKQLKIKGL